jgi:hypothetical protein
VTFTESLEAMLLAGLLVILLAIAVHLWLHLLWRRRGRAPGRRPSALRSLLLGLLLATPLMALQLRPGSRLPLPEAAVRLEPILPHPMVIPVLEQLTGRLQDPALRERASQLGETQVPGEQIWIFLELSFTISLTERGERDGGRITVRLRPTPELPPARIQRVAAAYQEAFLLLSRWEMAQVILEQPEPLRQEGLRLLRRLILTAPLSLPRDALPRFLRQVDDRLLELLQEEEDPDIRRALEEVRRLLAPQLR